MLDLIIRYKAMACGLLVSSVCARHSKNLESSRPAKRRKRLPLASTHSCHLKEVPKKTLMVFYGSIYRYKHARE